MEDSMSSLSGYDSWMTEPMVHGTLERVFWSLFFSLTRDGDSGKSVRLSSLSKGLYSGVFDLV